MKATSIILIYLLLNSFLFAQNKRANIWQIVGAGQLNFNFDPVQVNQNIPALAINISSQSATISDTSGNILFYTNGEIVANALNDTMPNGTGLFGKNLEGFNNVIIVPKPLSNSVYYIFYVTWYYDGVKMHEELAYSVVDMGLDNGNGDVVQKNIVICDSISQRVAATFHSNGKDVWVVVHKLSGNEYNSFLVTPDSINSIPVVSNSGTLYTGSNSYCTGQMKISGNGSMIAASMRTAKDSSDLSQFNNSTGIISNTITIQDGMYGIEFSPDNKKMYGAIVSSLYQYDLSYWNVDSILNSKEIVFSGTTLAKLGKAQLASNGKIYIARNGNNYLGVINNPNAGGAACDFVLDGLSLNGLICPYVLPNFISSYFDFSTSVESPKLRDSKFEVYPNPASNVLQITSEELQIKNCKLKMYDLFGREVLETSITGQNQTIDISQVQQGVYVYKIEDNKGVVKSGKLVVMR
ncbi:MAG: hypothetical protein A2033_02415 [Bacteroidetes bacterium GWA2_31_9]|nr:MAG: hypothetical protein A2033_02415 [Bacteroidetes bacterium GWA2_31_9]